MFDVFPVLGWLTVAVGIFIARAMRVSDVARKTHATAGISLRWLLAPALLSWLLLVMRAGELWKTHVVLFVIELSLALFIVRRYRAWVVLPGLLAAVCLAWSGGIALQGWRAHPYRIGPDLPTPRGATQASVSASFSRRELELVLARAQQFGTSEMLSEFSCGDPLPGLSMSVELRPGGEYEERRVILAYLPRLDDKNQCLDRGIDYLFEEAVRSVDHGPPVDYGYVNPSTRQPLYSPEWEHNNKPICRCDLRGTGRDWVAYTEKRAAELR